MATDREIALEQALVALLGSAMAEGVSDNPLVARGMTLILDNSKFRITEHPHVTQAVQELSAAHEKAIALAQA